MQDKEMKSKAGESFFYVTILNVLACFSVIALHTNGVFWTRPVGRLWISSNFIETFFYFAVPVFFMCSGVTLLDYPARYTTREFFRKRCEKTLLPFLVWSLLFFALSVKKLLESGGTPDWNIVHVVANIFNTANEYCSVYWSFPALFAIYLAMPVLANVKEKKKLYLYIAALGFIFVCTLPLLCGILHVNYNTSLTPGLVSGYLLYPILGYLCGNLELKRWQRGLIYVLGILGWLMQFAGTILLSGEGEINDLFKGYTNLPAVLQAIGIFVFARYALAPLLEKSKGMVRVFSWFAKRTFGIYLMHYYFVAEIPKIFGIDVASISWRTVGSVGVFLLCAGVTWLLQQIPVVKRIVP